MAFNLELIKTRVADFVHGLEADLGAAAERVLEGLHAVVESVHAQVVHEESQATTPVGATASTETPAPAEEKPAAAAEPAATEPAAPSTPE